MTKVASEIVLIIILEKSELVHIILYFTLQYLLSQLLIKVKTNTNIFLEKGLYKDKSNMEYF